MGVRAQFAYFFHVPPQILVDKLEIIGARAQRGPVLLQTAHGHVPLKAADFFLVYAIQLGITRQIFDDVQHLSDERLHQAWVNAKN